MLTKRTHILFNQTLWDRLADLAKRENTSVGELVRTAVKEKLNEEEKIAKRTEAIEAILRLRKKSKGKIDYKALINEGRRI